MEKISMSLQRRKRLKVFSRVRLGEMTLMEASELLRLRKSGPVWCDPSRLSCHCFGVFGEAVPICESSWTVTWDRRCRPKYNLAPRGDASSFYCLRASNGTGR
jgi:hypothetical protein